MAARYPVHPVFPAVQLPVPGFTSPEKEDDVLLRERDLRIEETRGGFVLVARITAPDPDSVSGSHRHRMVLDKYGKPSIRKTIAKVSFLLCVSYKYKELRFPRKCMKGMLVICLVLLQDLYFVFYYKTVNYRRTGGTTGTTHC